jgi:hypothetical protein
VIASKVGFSGTEGATLATIPASLETTLARLGRTNSVSSGSTRSIPKSVLLRRSARSARRARRESSDGEPRCLLRDEARVFGVTLQAHAEELGATPGPADAPIPRWEAGLAETRPTLAEQEFRW